MSEQNCRCEGCSRLGWLIVRLPEPLYRLARWADEWITSLRIAPPFSRARRDILDTLAEADDPSQWVEVGPFHEHDWQVEYLPDPASAGAVVRSGDLFCDCGEATSDWGVA